MNPLKSIPGTIATGFIIAIILLVTVTTSKLDALGLEVWFHVIAGITWIGLLYYFNFVQVPGVGAALANSEGPQPAAINKYIAPRALLWFRWAAVVTWVTGIGALQHLPTPGGAMAAFTLADGFEVIGLGAWLGTIMLFNVWVFIWPNQKKILGIVDATAEQIASAKVVALMASRTNTVLSIPMLLTMVGYGHGLTFSF